MCVMWSGFHITMARNQAPACCDVLQRIVTTSADPVQCPLLTARILRPASAYGGTLRQPVFPSQVLAAGASAVALVRSPKTSTGLQELQTTHGERLMVVGMDAGVFSSIQAGVQQCACTEPAMLPAH